MDDRSVIARACAVGSSRRRFLKSTLAGAVAASAIPLLGRESRAATPNKGGNLKVGIADGGTEDTLDLSKTNGSRTSVQTNVMMRGYLTEVGIDSKVKPALAESWEPSSDAKTWHFKLRKGTEFSNGKTITQDDVIFSLNLHRGENSKSGAKPLVAVIADIKKDGGDGLVFELSGGVADFPMYLTDYHLGIVPQNDKNVQEDISSGSYVLEKFEPGVRATFKRFGNYWDQDAAKFDTATLLVINDIVARTNALLSKNVDVINQVDVKTASKLAQAPGVKVTRAASGYHPVFAMDCRTDLYKNNDVRLALKYAIDREQILKTVLQGYGTLGNDQPISPVYEFYAADIPQRTYDPDKARFHLKKAGIANAKFDFSITEAMEYGIEYGQLYQQHAKKAGIELNLINEPADGYWDKVWLVKPFVQGYWWGRPTADLMLTTGYTSTAPWNDAHYANAKLDQILAEARATLDTARRTTLYHDAQLIIRDEGGVIVPIFGDYLVATRDTLTNGGTMSGSAELDGWRFAERWWFA
jgi:peptide/nickel transport system substrate-binding protein